MNFTSLKYVSEEKIVATLDDGSLFVIEPYTKVLWAKAVSGEFGDVTPYVPPPVDRMGIRSKASLSRSDFCLATIRVGVLTKEDAVFAARGEWPTAFDAFIASLNPDEATAAKIQWAAATSIRYNDPLLQSLAVAHSGNGAQALLDEIFAIPTDV